MALIYQPGLLQTIAYLMGERTVNSTTSTSRADFLQKTLSEVYSAYPWKFAKALATLSISSGIATLPTDYDNAHPLRVYYMNGSSEQFLEEIDPDDRNRVSDGSSAYWLTNLPTGLQVLNTKDTAPTQIVVDYSQIEPTLDTNGTVGTPYPNAMTLALGARRYVKLGQNPDADISQDQSIFEKSLAGDIAGEQVPRARKRRNTRQRLTGRATGDW